MKSTSAWPWYVMLSVAVAFYGCGSEPGEREMRIARRNLQRGEYVRAKSWLEKAIGRRPGSEENAEAYTMLGTVCYRLGELQRSVSAFEQARKLNADSPEPPANLGILMHQKGDSFLAATLLEEASLIDIEDTRALEYLAAIYLEEERWPDARRALYDALSRAPGSPRILTALGVAERPLEGPAAAERHWMEALGRRRDYAPALFNLALVCAEQPDRLGDARAYAERYLELEPDHPRAARMKQLLADLDEASAGESAPPPGPSPEFSRPAPEPSAAPEPAPAPGEQPAEPERAAEPQPDPPAEDSGARRFQELIAQGEARAAEGFPQQALNLFLQAASDAGRRGDDDARRKALETAVKRCFDQARAHYAMGLYRLEKGEIERAGASFVQAVTLQPEWTLAHRTLAELAVREGDFDTALISLKKAVSLSEDDPEALWMLAELYDLHLDLSAPAAERYRTFSRRFPDDPRSLRAAERLRELAPAPAVAEAPPRRTESAERPAAPPPRRDATPGRPRDPRAALQAYNRGTVYQSRGDLDRAVEAYIEAMDADPQFATAYFNLGAVYSMQGRHARAEEAYLRALEMRPDNVDARYNLALVYYNANQPIAAIEQLNAALRQQPDHAPAHYLLGLIYDRRMESPARAARHYRRYLELAPDSRNAPAVRRWLRTARPTE
jgi:tetratricopeptide (TPR) repeat protein